MLNDHTPSIRAWWKYVKPPLPDNRSVATARDIAEGLHDASLSMDEIGVLKLIRKGNTLYIVYASE